jgi:hypothetical protein
LNNDIFSWFFGAAVVAVIVGLIVSQIQARRRTAALQATAKEMGFIFEGEDWSDQAQSPQLGTVLFERGGGGRFKNIMSGTAAGFKTSLFDYSYTVGGGKSSRTYTQTVAAFSQDLSLPLFEMRPEGFVDRIADAIVHKDIDFESHPEFSRRYLLRGPEPEKVREFFTPALLTFLEGVPSEEKWHIEGAGTTLVLYRSDFTVNAERTRAFLNETSAIARTFCSSRGLKPS